MATNPSLFVYWPSATTSLNHTEASWQTSEWEYLTDCDCFPKLFLPAKSRLLLVQVKLVCLWKQQPEWSCPILNDVNFSPTWHVDAYLLLPCKMFTKNPQTYSAASPYSWRLLPTAVFFSHQMVYSQRTSLIQSGEGFFIFETVLLTSSLLFPYINWRTASLASK